MDWSCQVSEPKLIMKVELDDNGKLKLALGTRHPALLSLALQLLDIEVKDNILRGQEQQAQSDIITEVPSSLMGKL